MHSKTEKPQKPPRIMKTYDKVWRRCKKTATLKAKPMSALLDGSVANRFLLDTLEGREPVDMRNIYCVGAAGDAWQQTPKALLKKYTVEEIDDDGWMLCVPKPDNEAEFFMADKSGWIQGKWGQTVGGLLNLQSVTAGDYICRQPHEHADQWVVRRTLFLNTYAEIMPDGRLLLMAEQTNATASQSAIALPV